MTRRERAREWLADHLVAIVIVLLALWAPPVIFTVLVDLKLVDAAGSGYPTLRDPGLLLALLQIALMIAALPLLSWRQARGWQLLAGACGVWLAHAAWTIQGRVRLVGVRDLATRETMMTIVALMIACLVLNEVRARYLRAGAITSQPTGQRRAARQPDRT